MLGGSVKGIAADVCARMRRGRRAPSDRVKEACCTTMYATSVIKTQRHRHGSTHEVFTSTEIETVCGLFNLAATKIHEAYKVPTNEAPLGQVSGVFMPHIFPRDPV